MAETGKQRVKSKRDIAVERLRSRYPEREFNDDESIFGQMSDDYDALDSQLSGYKDREQKWADMFTSDPRSAHFINNWREGKDPNVEFVRQFGRDMLEAANDPSRLEEFAEANKDYLERVAENDRLEQEYKQNLADSLKYLETWQSESGLSDDEVDKVMGLLVGIVRDGIMGKFSPESIAMAVKAINHDADVDDASQEGEVRGRNSKIDERLRRRSQGDGTAPLDGKNRGGSASARRDLGVLDNYGDGTQNIWERGGEKRRKN